MIGLLVAASLAIAQRQGPGRDDGPPPGESDDLVTRMMAFDKDKDGKLTRAEITDARLTRLFDRSDANKDGIVTKEELAAVVKKDQALDRGGPGGGPFGGGPRVGGPPGGGPPGGFMMGMPRPGEILPRMVRQRLNLTASQIDDLNDLQKDVDSKLDKILTVEQRTILKEMRERGPGGPGGPGGFGPPGGRRFGGGVGPPPGGGGFRPPPGGDRSPPADET